MDLALESNNFTASYNVYKYYYEARRRWEVRIRFQKTINRIFHTEAEADNYIKEVKSVMKGKERPTRVIPKYKYKL